ncbi:MAG: hypothetical protein KI791_21410 [Cyclobacteriaceae bacterium]|nr:hypothetical protein [Cyclobacteriaceae bacterium SS2]
MSTTTFCQQLLGQPEGLYKANYYYYGNWFKILIIHSDGNYEFAIRTDIGEQPIEPESGLRPKWTFDSLSSIIHLHGTTEYEPEITSLKLDESSNLIESQEKSWEKIIDTYPNGILWKYKDNDGSITTYDQTGIPVTKEFLNDKGNRELKTFKSFTAEEKEEVNEFFEQSKAERERKGLDTNKYLHYTFYHVMMMVFLER